MKLKKILFWIFVVFCFFFFAFKCFNEFYFLRQPTRNVPNDNSVFVSPANGTIIKVIKQDDLTDWNTELYKQNNLVIDNWTRGFTWATLVSIMMTPFDAHFQKAPLLAKLVKQHHHEWHFFNATKTSWVMKSTFQNEYNSMLYVTPEGYKFRIIQIAWTMAWRIVSLLEPNDIVEQWQFIWAIKLWSQVSIVFDENFDIEVNEWDYVIDWETVLAKKKDTSAFVDKFEDWNIIWDEEVDLDIENAVRYSTFELVHPSKIVFWFWIIILIVQILTWMKFFELAHVNKWKVFIPFYNVYLVFKIWWKAGWFPLIFIIPILFFFLLIVLDYFDVEWLINLWTVLFVVCSYLPMFFIQYPIAKKFWKSNRFATWMWLFPIIFYTYLVWIDKAKYRD